MNKDIDNKYKQEINEIKKETIGSKMFIGTIILLVIFLILLYFNEHFISFVIVFVIIIIGELIAYGVCLKQSKNKYLYITGKKKINFDNLIINKNKFLELCNENFEAYLLIKKNIYYIEVVNSKDKNIFIINYDKFNDIDSFLNWEIDDCNLNNLGKYNILMYNDRDPKENLNK